MRRSGTTWATVALMGATLGVAAVPAQATTTCPTGWGSLAKSRAVGTTDSVTNAKAGRHTCYDRLVVEIPGADKAELGYSVRYVPQVHQDGSGRVVPVAGGAVLEVRVAAPAYDIDTGSPTYPGRAGRPLPGVNLDGYRTFRDARFVGSFEGDTQFGLGVRARLPFRVLRVDDRVVVDVAHTWGAKP